MTTELILKRQNILWISYLCNLYTWIKYTEDFVQSFLSDIYEVIFSFSNLLSFFFVFALLRFSACDCRKSCYSYFQHPLDSLYNVVRSPDIFGAAISEINKITHLWFFEILLLWESNMNWQFPEQICLCTITFSFNTSVTKYFL